MKNNFTPEGRYIINNATPNRKIKGHIILNMFVTIYKDSEGVFHPRAISYQFLHYTRSKVMTYEPIKHVPWDNGNNMVTDIFNRYSNDILGVEEDYISKYEETGIPIGENEFTYNMLCYDLPLSVYIGDSVKNDNVTSIQYSDENDGYRELLNEIVYDNSIVKTLVNKGLVLDGISKKIPRFESYKLPHMKYGITITDVKTYTKGSLTDLCKNYGNDIPDDYMTRDYFNEDKVLCADIAQRILLTQERVMTSLLQTFCVGLYIPYSLSSAGLNYYKLHYVGKNGIYNLLGPNPKHPRGNMQLLMEQRSYFGALNFANFIGKFDKEIVQIDANNLYGMIAKLNMYPVKAVQTCISVGEDKQHQELTKKKILSLYNLSEEDELNLGYRYGFIADVVLDVPKDTLITSYPYKYKDTNLNRQITLFPTGEFETTLTTPELILAIERGHIRRIKTYNIYAMKPIFFEFMEEIESLRKLYTRGDGSADIVLKHFVKMIVNQAIGKLGERNKRTEMVESSLTEGEQLVEIDEEGNEFHLFNHLGKSFKSPLNVDSNSLPITKNTFPAIPAHIVAYARVYMLQIVEKVINEVGKEHFLYIDNDGIIITLEGLKCLENIMDNTGVKLGRFKEEFRGYAEIRNTKSYTLTENKDGTGKIKDIDVFKPKNSIRTGDNTFSYVERVVNENGLISDISKEITVNYSYLSNRIKLDTGYTYPIYFEPTSDEFDFGELTKDSNVTGFDEPWVNPKAIEYKERMERNKTEIKPVISEDIETEDWFS